MSNDNSSDVVLKRSTCVVASRTTQKKTTAGLAVPFVENVGLDDPPLFVEDGDDVRDDRAKLIVIY